MSSPAGCSGFTASSRQFVALYTSRLAFRAGKRAGGSCKRKCRSAQTQPAVCKASRQDTRQEQGASEEESAESVRQNGANAHRNGAGSEGIVASDGDVTTNLNLLKRWRDLPSQYQLVFASSVAFVICNMDKVNISVAIIAMSRDFGWSPTVSGIVQSSFFAGYMATQIPGGYIISRLGGRRVLPAGVSLWSLATAATPVLAGSLPGIMMCRVLVGLGEGVAPGSATDMVARSCKQSERSRAIGFIFSGLHVGSLVGLLVAPILIERLGWPAVFYIFGGLGLLWSFWWESLMKGIKEGNPDMADKLEGRSENNRSDGKTQQPPVPWRAFLRNRPLQALAYVHFCNNWTAFVMTAWLPSYFSDALGLDLTEASQAALFPPIAAIIASAIASSVADHVVSQGTPVGRVRKTAQAVAFLGPATFFALAIKLAGSGGSSDNEFLTVALISGALGMSAASVAGLYSNHADLSLRYASILLGLTNTLGALPGIIGVTAAGIIFDNTHDWNLALFAPSIFFYLSGTVVFALFGSADQQQFDNNDSFAVEQVLEPATQRISKLSLGEKAKALWGQRKGK